MTDHTEDQVKSWERHISTVSSGIVILLLGWMGSSVISMGNDITSIKVKLETAVNIQHTLANIQSEHGTMTGRLNMLALRVNVMKEAQVEEDTRERKEHGSLP